MVCRYQKIIGAKVDLPDGNQMVIKGEEIEHGVNQMVRSQENPSLWFLRQIRAPRPTFELLYSLSLAFRLKTRFWLHHHWTGNGQCL